MTIKRTTISVILLLTFTACPKRIVTVAIPSDRNITAIVGDPGYFRISGGYLQDIYDQEKVLLDQLQQCKDAASVPAK